MTVHLVGAGPGDPDLLTVRAARLLAQADVVVHDALVDESILALVPHGVERIDVGKRPGLPVPQETINELLIRLGGAHECVVRLKGGDPYVFGRGGEEAEALMNAGIDCDVVPAVSAALAAPAAAGIPVTHRGVAAAVTIVTGHRRQGEPPVDWAALAATGSTLVVLMGVSERSTIVAGLLEGGLAPLTPVAVIERATRADQRVVRAHLIELPSLDIEAPATLVIGAVAARDDARFRSSAVVDGAQGRSGRSSHTRRISEQRRPSRLTARRPASGAV